VIYKQWQVPSKQPTWLDEIGAAIACLIGIPVVVMIEKFKINKRDAALIAGYIFCCGLVLYMVWSLNTPLEHVGTPTVWTNTTNNKCYYAGLTWEARNSVCYMEDMPK